MTKKEAIKLMKKGVKMTHKYFSDDEWIYIGNDGRYVLEDGVECDYDEFWHCRQDEQWNNDWSIFKPH